MKGPFERLKYDLQRVWECPACHLRQRTSGEVSSRFCPCQDKVAPAQRVCMRLLADGVRRHDGTSIHWRRSIPALPEVLALPELIDGPST